MTDLHDIDRFNPATHRLSGACVLMVLLLATGCATTLYKPDPTVKPNMSAGVARQRILEELNAAHNYWGGDLIDVQMQGWTMSYTVTKPVGRCISMDIREMPSPEVCLHFGKYTVSVFYSVAMKGALLPYWNNEASPRAVADAILALKYHASGQFEKDEAAAFAAFQEQARAWRALPQKPPLPEEVVRFRVQAEDAFRNHEFSKAISCYRKGLALQPLWPEGHLNTALICAELEDYEAAVCRMKWFLELMPEDKDAKKLRDQMYAWEGKLR